MVVVVVVLVHLKFPIKVLLTLNASALPTIASTTRADNIIFAFLIIQLLFSGKKLNLTLQITGASSHGSRAGGWR